MTPVAVLGTGMAGFGAGHALRSAGIPFVCYDRNSYFGGHTRSLRYESGFVFDEGGHISFTKHQHVKDLLAQNVTGQYEERRLRIDNYWRGYRIPHPVQCNLRGLPVDLILQVINDFVSVRGTKPRSGGNYAEWLHTTYGKTFADTFPMVYGRKYHTIEMARLTTDWIGPRMYRPSLEDMVRGAIGEASSGTHYVDTFRYPSSGGFMSYLEPFARQFDLALGHSLSGVDPQARVLRFTNGKAEKYHRLISSVPLPELIPLIDGAPDGVRQAAKTLAFTTAVLVNLGIDRANLPEAAITYFYDEDVIFSRINLPHLFSSNNAPPGCGTIQAEVYFSEKYKPLAGQASELIRPVVKDLRRCGILRENDRILLSDAVVNRFANVIFDFDRAAALKAIHGFLDEIGVHYCGRYGNWDHAWTDEAFVSGEQAAMKALQSAR